MTGGEPKPEFDYDSLPVGYYDERIRRDQGVQSKWHRIEFDIVRRAIAARRPLLDVGCGPGTFLGTFGPDERVHGLDVAGAQIEFARTEYGTATRTFDEFDGGGLPIEGASYEAICMIEVIEHLHDVSGPLVEAMRVLRPGGRIVVTTPNYASHWPILEWLVGKLSPVDYAHQHVTKFRPRSLDNALRDAGFENVEVRSFMRTAPFVAAISSRFSDAVRRLEERVRVVPGALLVGVADKPGPALGVDHVRSAPS